MHLQTQLTRRVGGTQLGVVYTYSKAIDDDDGFFSTLTWNWGPVLGRNKALAGFDRTHNLQMYAVYGSPFGHNQHWMTQGVGAAILGGWTLSPILSRESGTPFTVGSSRCLPQCTRQHPNRRPSQTPGRHPRWTWAKQPVL